MASLSRFVDVRRIFRLPSHSLKDSTSRRYLFKVFWLTFWARILTSTGRGFPERSTLTSGFFLLLVFDSVSFGLRVLSKPDRKLLEEKSGGFCDELAALGLTNS